MATRRKSVSVMACVTVFFRALAEDCCMSATNDSTGRAAAASRLDPWGGARYAIIVKYCFNWIASGEPYVTAGLGSQGRRAALHPFLTLFLQTRCVISEPSCVQHVLAFMPETMRSGDNAL